MDHCIAFLQKKRKQEELIYYMTDALMYIAENTANASGGKAISTRFFNIINPKPEETRTAEDIIDQIKKKLGG